MAPFVLSFALWVLVGCRPYMPEASLSGATSLSTSSTRGIYHRVERGQTLWRIAKTYGVDLDQVVAANRLSDAGRIEVGQQLFVPGATEARSTVASTKPLAAQVPASSSFVPGEDFVWPVRGRVISVFGSQTPLGPNKGVNIGAQEGTHVVAARSGRVSFLDENLKGYGKTIIIDHGDQLSTVYTHLASIGVVVGDSVRQGQPIGTVGSTGRAAAPFLHFEIRRRHRAENPFYFLS